MSVRAMEAPAPRVRGAASRPMIETTPIVEPAPAAIATAAAVAPARNGSANWSPLRIAAALALPSLCAAIALWIHRAMPSRQNPTPTHDYPLVLQALLGLSPLLALLYAALPAARPWARHIAPLLGAGILVFAAWDVITLKLALLPLPYFPGPDAVFTALYSDRARLAECTWRSLLLLASGYALGGTLGFVTGVLVGWFPRVRYWVMPVLRIVGPIPATALIPLSIMLFPSSFLSGTALIAMAVWFPMTMLTSSGVASVRVSHLDVARTLGAGRAFLILRVAVPSALPNIFLGLFMGLGAAFLTLIAAEAVGVKSGLGWYIDLGRNYAEYDMIYASLLVTAAFFSTIMAILFRVRDYVLVWQKGVLKW
jgi:NitT/TauT family transport system permease protein